MKFTIEQKLYWEVRWKVKGQDIDYDKIPYDTYQDKSQHFQTERAADDHVDKLQTDPNNIQIRMARWFEVS